MKRFACLFFMLVVCMPALATQTAGPGLHETPMCYDKCLEGNEPLGLMGVYNTKGEFIVDVSVEDGWLISELHLFIGPYGDGVELTDILEVPLSKKGDVKLSDFPHKRELDPFAGSTSMVIPFEGLFSKKESFAWGEPWKHKRIIAVALHADLVKYDADGNEIRGDAWGLGPISLEGSKQGTALNYEMAHPKNCQFRDSPVEGLGVRSPTFWGKTDDSGSFLFFPGETGEFRLGNTPLGSTLLDRKVTPVDLFEQADIDDPRVINMARLLQSLDFDRRPQDKIQITEPIETCLNEAMVDLGLTEFDFTDDAQIESIIQGTIAKCAGTVTLLSVSAEDAKANLDKSINSNMFRKNVSRTPELPSSKAKLNVMGVWFPARQANGDLAYYTDENKLQTMGVAYYDEEGDQFLETTEAKPLVITYTDADSATGAHDVWAAVSRDDGNTWKRKNLSRMADRSSFELANGTPYYGHTKKPVFHVKGNKILIAWTSKFARGGKPRYAIQKCPDIDGDGMPDPCDTCTGDGDNEQCGPDYIYDDKYYQEDIWGVSGPQRSVDYTEQDFPEVGEVPYSAVWVTRGIIAAQSDVDKGVGDYVGDIVWFKPERLTSGRRDANQVFMGGADSAGFAIAWQEDPEGLRPGDAMGPGPGWGGATTNHKTDIWYSYITWADFAKVDENFVAGGDPEHDDPDFVGRPKALVPMSLPVRISDNDAVNTDNMMIELGEDGIPVRDESGNFIPILNPDATSDDAEGSHRYGYLLDGLWDWNDLVYSETDEVIDWQPEWGEGALFRFTNQQGDPKQVIVTRDGRALDGNTGASRPNLFLQTYCKVKHPTDPSKCSEKSAFAIMAYEETKGMGSGPSDEHGTGIEPADGTGYDPYAIPPDEGKNAIYHSFDFQTPDLVSPGMILNLPETDELGNDLYVVQPEYLGSDPILDGDGNITGYDPIPNPIAGELVTDWKGDSQYAYENARRPRFILQSKTSAFGGIKSYDVDGKPVYKESYNSGTVLIVLYKEGEEGHGRPSDIMARRFVVKKTDGTIKGGNPWDPSNLGGGVQNVSTVVPGETWINPDRDPNAKGDGIKVCDWSQPETALGHKSGSNPYEDARAHRGQIRGDFVIMGYSYTPNWAASRNAHDKYDLYIRRSFNGGVGWGTDPVADPDYPVVHTDYYFDPDGISGFELDEMGNDISEPTKHYTVDTPYGPGVYEPARNVSLFKNNKSTVIEPRIVAPPGTIKENGVWTGEPEDKQNRNVFYLAYGTSTNLPNVEKMPEDLYLSFSRDRGTTLELNTWVVNPESEGNNAGETVTDWFRLAKGDAEQGEVQMRMTPDGARFYGSWLEEGNEGSDVVLRRIMSSVFPQNVADVTPTE